MKGPKANTKLFWIENAVELSIICGMFYIFPGSFFAGYWCYMIVRIFRDCFRAKYLG